MFHKVLLVMNHHRLKSDIAAQKLKYLQSRSSKLNHFHLPYDTRIECNNKRSIYVALFSVTNKKPFE